MSEETETNTASKKSLGERITEGVSAIPPILGCTALAYILDMQGCVEQIDKALPEDGLNLGYHLAAGAGLYGGYTGNKNKKITSLVALGASFAPEIQALSQGADIESLGAASAAKLVGYGVAYVVGHLFGG